MDPRYLILAFIVFCSYLIGAITGFGSAIIVLTVGVNFFPLDFLIPLVIPLNLIICCYLVIRHHSGIQRGLLGKRILPLAGIGLPIGLVIFNTVETRQLKLGFGAFVLSSALFELYRLVRSEEDSSVSSPSSGWSGLWLLLGGIAQGIWVSGGPLIAYWAGRNIPSKGAFRSTLSSVFLLLNAALLASHLVAGRINLETVRISGLLIPFMAVGIALGEFLHVKLPERTFRMVVFLVLVFAGVSIVVRG